MFVCTFVSLFVSPLFWGEWDRKVHRSKSKCIRARVTSAYLCVLVSGGHFVVARWGFEVLDSFAGFGPLPESNPLLAASAPVIGSEDNATARSDTKEVHSRNLPQNSKLAQNAPGPGGSENAYR